MGDISNITGPTVGGYHMHILPHAVSYLSNVKLFIYW